MRYIVLFLMSFSAFAGYVEDSRVEIKNRFINNIKPYRYQIAKKTGSQVVNIGAYFKDNPQSLQASCVDVATCDGSLAIVALWESKIPEVQADIAAAVQTKADRIIELNEIRSMIGDVNASALPPWHKKLLRRLIRELKD